MRGLRAAVIALALLAPGLPLTVPLVAAAATCGPHANATYPNDPEFAPAEDAPTSGQTWDNEAWYLYPCIPQTAPASHDPEGASGMSVSALWNRTTNPNRGDGVVVSYMEGGVNWRIPTSCELKDRALLNTGELPYPEDASGHTHATYDLNGDGVVNVEGITDISGFPSI